MVYHAVEEQTLLQKIRALPPEKVTEVEDFVDFLLQMRLNRPRSRPGLGWAGALRDLREQFTSVELQHRVSEWRMGSQ